MKTISISEIQIGARHRKDFGDLQELADSIFKLGLLQPIGVTPDRRLVFGQRRIKACELLDWEEIPCRVIDIERIVDGEYAENEVRKDFTVSERLAIAKAVELEIGNRQGQRTDINPPEPPQDFVEVRTARAAETLAIAAKKAGFGNPETYRQAKVVEAKGSPELISAVDSGKVAVSTAAAIAEAPREQQRAIVEMPPKEIIRKANEIKRETKRVRQEARKAEAVVLAATVPQVSDRYRLIVSSVEALGAQIEHASVDWVITDPPYPREYVNLYGQLSMLSEAVLKPGGSLLAMTGQSYLPEVMDQLATSLCYHWALAYLTPGGQAPHLFDRKVNTFWKPVLWYTKGQYHGAAIGDVVKSAVNDNDKRFHHWGQSESGIAELIEKFTKPGDTILDPFVGGGSTAVVAVKLGRRFIGADISEEAITMTRARLSEAA